MIHRLESRWDEARSALQAALAIRREVGPPAFASRILGELGRLYLIEDRLVEAAEMLESAESRLREADDRITLGKVLCRRAELEHRNGNSAVAESLQSEAEALALEMEVGPESALARELEQLRRVRDASRSSRG
jgi:hypothetical protein